MGERGDKVNENESEQAQAITEIRAIRNGGEYPREYYREAIDKALKIVDSQAQKNEKLLAENNVLAILVDELKADRG